MTVLLDFIPYYLFLGVVAMTAAYLPKVIKL